MRSNATINPVMTGHAVQFLRAPMGFVGLRLFPAFPSAQQASDYYVWSKENSLNIPKNLRHAPGTPFARTLPKLADDGFATKDYGHETPVPDEIRAKYRNHINADISAIRRNVEIMKVNHELRVKALATSGSVPNSAIGTQWDDPESDPKADVDLAKEEIRKNSGQRPNVMVISEAVKQVLETHPVIAERVKYTTTGVTSVQILAAYFGVAEILVAEQVINSAAEGQAITPADIWEDDVLLALVDPSQDLMRPTFGRTFWWSQFAAGTQDDVPLLVESYRDDSVASDIHRTRHFVDEKLVFPEAGYRLTNALS